MTDTTDEVIPEQTLDIKELVRPKVSMFYGGAGAGKTVLASTYPAPQVWIDLDRGMDSVMWAIRESICPHKITDFRRATPSDKTDGRGKLISATGMWQTIDRVNAWLEQPDTWNTMVIDPLTTVNAFAMTAGMEISGRYPTKAKPFSKSGAHSKEAGLLLIEIQDYKPAQSFIRQFIDPLRKTCVEQHKWILLLCHEHEIMRAGANIGDLPTLVGVEPDLFGKQRKDVVKDMDEVYYLKPSGTKVDRKFEMLTVGDGFTIAKSRFGCLDVKMKPDYQVIKEKVEEYYGIPLR